MSQSGNIFQQPKSFYTIFFIEFWERFGFYGLQILLAVYLVKELKMPESQSFIIFGAFFALAYGLVAIGGYLGDNVLGTKRTIVLGAVVLSAGYGLLAFAGTDQQMIYLGLGTVAVGNGLFKANPSSLLAKCYEKGDPRLDSAFTLYYMAINFGGAVSGSIAPYLAHHYGWSIGFLLSVVGMFVALGNYWLTRHWVKDAGSPADFRKVSPLIYGSVLFATILSCFLSGWILKHLMLADTLLAIVGISVLFLFLKEIISSSGSEQRKMLVALMLMFQAIVFFVLFLQGPTAINFFALHNVEHSLFGIPVEAETFQSLNPFWIVILSPFLAYIYSKSNNAMPMPTKFAVGMLITSCAFFVPSVAATFANDQGIVSGLWLVLSYFFSSLGELLISGLGLAMIAQLVPERMHGFIMGAWFLTISAASVLSGYLATFAAVPQAGANADPLHTLSVYSHYFNTVGLVAAAIAVVMLLMAPRLNGMIQGESVPEGKLAAA